MNRFAVLGVVVAIGLGSFVLGRVFTGHEAPATVTPAKAADPELVTGTIAASPPPALAQPQTPSTPPNAPPPANEKGSFPIAARDEPGPACKNPDALGVSRVVEIDTTGGPGFGFPQFKAYDFLEAGEVVLTFDDGPWPVNTPAVLAALAAQCVKATFFPIGKHSTWHPEILKQVVAAGQTVGSHTWSHADLTKKTPDEAKDEIEDGISAVAISAGRPLAPFFRFPALRQNAELDAYLGQRNIGIFSADIDSLDFKLRKPEKVITSVMTQLKKRGKGIILMHDFQHATAIALPELLNQLKAGGFKIVQVKAKDTITTLPQYDAAMMKTEGGQTLDDRPTSSVVRTVSGPTH